MSIACNGSPGQAPHALTAWLLAADYTGHARERIVAYVEAEGCLAGCPELDPEDHAVAEQVWVESLPAVPQTSAEWCDPMEWTLPDDELEAIDAENFARMCDIVDSPTPGEERWLRLMWSGMPPVDQCSPEEYSQLQSHGCV
jgi:hypothetical protein